MSTFACTCGHVIRDTEYPNEVTGWLISNKCEQEFYSAVQEVVDDYLFHSTKGEVDSWRQKHLGEAYSKDASEGEMIEDVLMLHLAKRTLDTLECDRCGRLWVQTSPGKNHYQGYSPDAVGDERQKLLGYNIAEDHSESE